ncbi:MAG: InlB B-repeat-containing protein [Clostridia bacterium]|nr:InlB B-repeat-containing protein [Clostridia bacterium]
MRILKKDGIWKYRTISFNNQTYATIVLNADVREFIVPTSMAGYDIYRVAAIRDKKMKVFLDKKNSNVFSLDVGNEESIVVLTSLNPQSYSNGLENRGKDWPCTSIVNKRICVPSYSVEYYNYMYHKYLPRTSEFIPANVSYMLNYDYESDSIYIWENVFVEEQAYEYFLKKNNNNNPTAEELSDYISLHEYIYIDESDYNGGYYWVDYLEDGESINTCPVNPQREGFVFTGWYIDNNCSQLFDFDSWKYSGSELILYAGWEINN